MTTVDKALATARYLDPHWGALVNVDELVKAGKPGVVSGVTGEVDSQARVDLANMQRTIFERQMNGVASRFGITRPEAYALNAFHGAEELDSLTPEAVRATLDGARAVQRRRVDLIFSGNHMPLFDPLLRELTNRGAEVRMLRKTDLRYEGGRLFHKVPGTDDSWREIDRPEAVVIRGGSGKVVNALEGDGVHVLNRREARGWDKITMARRAAETGLPMPRTIIADAQGREIRSSQQLRAAAEEIGYPHEPVVVKLPKGAGGKQVDIIRDEDDFQRIAAEWTDANNEQPLLVQRFHPEAKGTAYRVLATRDVHGAPRATSAYLRIAKPGEFKATGDTTANDIWAPLDGSGENGLPPEVRRIAEQGLDAMGGDVVGFDIFKGPVTHENPLGYYISEWNTRPGVAEHDVPMPYSDHMVPAIADYAVWGRRQG